MYGKGSQPDLPRTRALYDRILAKSIILETAATSKICIANTSCSHLYEAFVYFINSLSAKLFFEKSYSRIGPAVQNFIINFLSLLFQKSALKLQLLHRVLSIVTLLLDGLNAGLPVT